MFQYTRRTNALWVASETASTMQQAYAADVGETESAKAADAAKASGEALADKHPPPPPKKKWPMEKGQGSKAVNTEADTLADILLTLVNEKMAAEDLEKLRSVIVKQASELQQKKAEVLDLIQDAKAENENATARKNLFTVTPAAKPPRRSTLQDVEPKKYKSPTQRLGFEWASAPQRTDKNGDTVLCTPVLNTAAALDVLHNDAYTKDEKIYYAATLVCKALE